MLSTGQILLQICRQTNRLTLVRKLGERTCNALASTCVDAATRSACERDRWSKIHERAPLQGPVQFSRRSKDQNTVAWEGCDLFGCTPRALTCAFAVELSRLVPEQNPRYGTAGECAGLAPRWMKVLAKVHSGLCRRPRALDPSMRRRGPGPCPFLTTRKRSNPQREVGAM